MDPDPETMARSRADEMIKEAVASKEHILATPGREDFNNTILKDQQCLVQTSVSNVDDNYVMVGAHLETGLKDKIIKGEYIDFAKLLPKEKPSYDDNRLELVNKGGQTFFIPAADRDSGNGVSSFHKWEQAFRVFSNVYLKYFPEKATQLIQYNHVICTASATFIWDNVYAYDKEFRPHLSNFPNRILGIILQQAWAMCLKDRLGSGKQNFNKNGRAKKETCQRFNKGLCTAGRSCRYEHKCLGCGKFGHGIHICRNKNPGQASDGANNATTSANKN